MFEGVRLRLTAWYVGVLILIVIATSIFTYFMLSRSLEHELNESLQSDARSIAFQLGESGIAGLMPTGSSGSDGEGGEEGEEEDREVRFFTPSSGDTFYLVVDPSGRILANPLNVSITGLPDKEAAQRAAERGEAWTDVGSGDDDYRLYSYAIRHERESIGVVQVGRSLEEHRRHMQEALIVLGLAGFAGVALATTGGLALSGRALAPARRAFQRQREFVADASHEVRTPLTIVRGNAEMLEVSAGDRLNNEEKRYLRGIVGQTRYLERLTEDLSRLARMDRGDAPLRIEEIELKALLEEAAADARLLVGGTGVEVRVSSPQVRLRADRDRIREVLLILLDNAVRAVGGGGHVTLAARETENGVDLEVVDDGPGIPEEHRRLVFERFHRVDTGRSRREGGSGLGLAIAKAIVEAHGGAISAERAPGGGAAIRLHLPA